MMLHDLQMIAQLVNLCRGSVREPYLKLIHIMRSLEFKPRSDAPFLEFGLDIMEVMRRIQEFHMNVEISASHLLLSPFQAIGQEAHKLPSVFSFFRPEYRPPGRITSAGFVSPESQGMLNYRSLYKQFRCV
jgi:hypothetical protein